MVKKWKRELKHEERSIEREIRKIQMEENKTKMEIKKLAKQGDTTNVKVLAKGLVQSRKHVERLYQSKAQLNSVSMTLQQQLSMMKTASTMQKSTQIMTHMNNLVKVPAIQKVMMDMSREMEKAGLIEEMINDTLDTEEDDELADEEVDKVLDEIIMPLKGTNVATSSLPTAEKQQDPVDDLEKRLGALKG